MISIIFKLEIINNSIAFAIQIRARIPIIGSCRINISFYLTNYIMEEFFKRTYVVKMKNANNCIYL